MNARTPESTRQRILSAAFLEFYRHGFQGGSINRITEAAGVTKGAVFHHFASKQALGYAVVDEIIGPLLMDLWISRLATASNPLDELELSFRTNVAASLASGSWVQGCPLNNLAQEMSPLDAGFRSRIDALYGRWRSALVTALEAGQRTGAVSVAAGPHAVAALIVAAQMGIWGSGKSSQDQSVVQHATEGVCTYIQSLSP